MAVRTATATERRWRGVALLAVAGMLLTGCASMPGSGPVQRVDSSQRAEGESQARVFGVSPEEHAPPTEIVRGFLEAVTSDEARFDTAKEYLTREGRHAWDPFSSTTVLSSGPSFAPPISEPSLESSGERMLVQIAGDQLARVDASHVYTPLEGDYTETFELRQVDGEWRIDALPDGLIMGEGDFRRNYRSVDAYYYADLGPESARLTNGDDVLVADPVYVRRRIDPVGELIGSLLEGPSFWLDPVVTTAFPEGIGLADDEDPVIDESGTLSVRLTGVPRDWAPSGCERMGAQLLHSVQELSSMEVAQARLANRAGTLLCELSSTEAPAYAPGLLDGSTEHAYFLDEEQRLVSVSADGSAAPVPLSGPLGRGDAEVRDAAVSRDEDLAAGVSADGTSLYVAPLTGVDGLPEPVYERPLAGEDDVGLTAPSWDGLGDLWFADRDPAGQRLLRLRDGEETPEEIPVSGLGDDQRIEALRVASDGVRIAMLISDDEQHTTLQLGRVERSGPGDDAVVAVDDLRPVAPQLENVAAASWAGGSRLVVVGRPADGVEQWQFVSTDGSTATTPTVPGLNDVTGVAAAEEESRPLLAETADGIAELGDDAQWQLVAQHGAGPFYPG
jgi:lipoprotein LpqB-like beta-propeller protein